MTLTHSHITSSHWTPRSSCMMLTHSHITSCQWIMWPQYLIVLCGEAFILLLFFIIWLRDVEKYSYCTYLLLFGFVTSRSNCIMLVELVAAPSFFTLMIHTHSAASVVAGGEVMLPLADVMFCPQSERHNVNSYSTSRDNWCTMGGNGGCRVSEVRAGTTSPMPDHKGFKLQ